MPLALEAGEEEEGAAGGGVVGGGVPTVVLAGTEGGVVDAEAGVEVGATTAELVEVTVAGVLVGDGDFGVDGGGVTGGVEEGVDDATPGVVVVLLTVDEGVDDAVLVVSSTSLHKASSGSVLVACEVSSGNMTFHEK